jgi:hypothetical protein
MESDVEALRNAIHDWYGCNGKYAASISVHEPGWSGTVEMFTIDENPKAKFAFAWMENGATVAILAVPPIIFASDAVKAHLQQSLTPEQIQPCATVQDRTAYDSSSGGLT